MKTTKFNSHLERFKYDKLELSMELEQQKEELKFLFAYFKEHKKGIIWSAINPIDKETSLGSILTLVKGSIAPIIQSESGLRINANDKNNDATLLAGLAVMAVNGIKNWLESRKSKKKLKRKRSKHQDKDHDAHHNIEDNAEANNE